jgi:hypothetical protein
MHAPFDNELAMLVQSDEVAGREPPDCWDGVDRGLIGLLPTTL